jgi:hypothetical protein
MAQDVVADPSIGGDPANLVPDRLNVRVEIETAVFPVTGYSTDPTQAVQLANVGAAALVDELNRVGIGVGVFDVLSEAQAPRPPSVLVHPATRALLGAGCGLLAGLAAITTLALVRRPVVGRQDGDIPILGSVVLPSGGPGEHTGPRWVTGLGAVARALAEAPQERIVLVGEAGTAEQRRHLIVLLALALAPARTMAVEDDELRADVAARSETPPAAPSGPPGPRTQLVLVDGDGALEPPAGGRTGTVLVVPTGIAQSDLNRLAAEYRPEDLVGVVLVEVRRSPRLPTTTGLPKGGEAE